MEDQKLFFSPSSPVFSNVHLIWTKHLFGWNSHFGPDTSVPSLTWALEGQCTCLLHLPSAGMRDMTYHTPLWRHTFRASITSRSKQFVITIICFYHQFYRMKVQSFPKHSNREHSCAKKINDVWMCVLEMNMPCQASNASVPWEWQSLPWVRFRETANPSCAWVWILTGWA